MYIEHDLITPSVIQGKSIKPFNLREFRNKFNGRLVMRWTGLSQGPYLAETIEEFYTHIKEMYELNFYDYLSSRTPSEVRFDFMDYFDPFKSVFN